MDFLKLIFAIFGFFIIIAILNTNLLEISIEAIFALILFIPRKVWGFLNKGNRLIISFIVSLSLFITTLYFNNFKIEVYGNYRATLIAIFLSTIIIIPLMKFVERLFGAFAPERFPFWTGNIRHIPKDQSLKEFSADFLLNWLCVPVVLPLIGFYFFSVFRLLVLICRDILTFF